MKPEDEIVTVLVPPLIDREPFEAVQNRLKINNPKVTPPRVVNGSNLLTGICHCGDCGGAMTLRTGKSSRYRYYASSASSRPFFFHSWSECALTPSASKPLQPYSRAR